MTFKEIFKHGRVAAIAGNRNEGKTNNIMSLIVDFRKTNTTTQIYAYGLPPSLTPFLKRHNVKIIDHLRQLATKKDSIIILDEFQKLKLGDRRYKDILEELMDMIYHPEQNNYVLFCSPTTREYTSVIGTYINVWLIKSMYVSDCVNGSQLKDAISNYKGQYYKLGYFDIPKDKLLLINDDEQVEINCPYIAEADNKRDILSILDSDKNVKQNVSEKDDDYEDDY